MMDNERGAGNPNRVAASFSVGLPTFNIDKLVKSQQLPYIVIPVKTGMTFIQ